jgi:5-methylcytosine-specific restriction protein A
LYERLPGQITLRGLTDGGPDDPRWVVGVCPNCHRRAHYSRDAVEYNTKLAEIVQKLEQRPK